MKTETLFFRNAFAKRSVCNSTITLMFQEARLALIITPADPVEKKFRRALGREEPVARIFRSAVSNSNILGINPSSLENLISPSVRLSAEDLDVLTREAAKKMPSLSDKLYVDQGAYDGQFPPAYTNPHAPGGLINQES